MNKSAKLIFVLIAALFLCVPAAEACTSMLVSAKASATGRPLMWKHRDTGTEDNFIERVPARNGGIGYVALFDGGDTNLKQAWMGMNDAGFAIMNTASYNVQPDTARIKDREGYIMAFALQSCRRVDDFEKLIKGLPKPLGVQANFGVMDSMGGLAYFEVNDHNYKRFDVSDSESGYLIRTNFSFAGTKGGGYGYIRYNNVLEVLKPEIAAGKLSPEAFTEKASRTFYNSVLKHDYTNDTCKWVVDQDFIPRRSSSASIVIEGVNRDEPVSDMIMWTMLGYPPCSFVIPVTLTEVPEELRPTAEGFTSPFCNKVKNLKRNVFPLTTGNGPNYINMEYLRKVMEPAKATSLEMYKRVRALPHK